MSAPRRALSLLRRILNLKLCDNPPWIVYLPFAAHLFNATLFLIGSPILMWFSLRAIRLADDLLKAIGATSSDPVTPSLYWGPRLNFGVSLLGFIVGCCALVAARREWRRLRSFRGFEVIDLKESNRRDG